MNTPAQIIDSEILSSVDLAELLGCDKETAEQRIIAGDLPGTKFGRGWVIPRQAFLERLNEKAREEAAERRAALQAERAEAEQRGKANAQPSAMLPSSTPTGVKRDRRRQPPALPSLPTAAAC